MPDLQNPVGPATIVVAQVVDYDRLMVLDDIKTTNVLRAIRRDLLVPLLANYGARLVQITGDVMLLRFNSAVDAVSYAVMMQRAMMTRNADTEAARQVWLRVGIHLGDVVTDGNNMYGDGVDFATRLGVECAPGAVCVSRTVEADVRDRLAYPITYRGEVSTRANRPLQIYDLPADFIATLPETIVASDETLTPQVHFPVREGLQLNDAYEIDRLIGKGGMGEIFRGHEIQSGDPVAIKLIRLDLVDNGPALALFQKEASVLKHINHDAIVRYYVFSFDQIVRRHYLAMEFVDGQALSERLKSGPLCFEDVSALRQRVALGLQVAHERGIVHRDISPDNIILPGGNIARAKIIDFGIARSATVGGGTVIGGGFAGKYNYVSPEQLGLAGGDVTAKSDIYSFGLVLAEAISGVAIDMAGTQAEVIEKRRVVPDLVTVDSRLRSLIAQMLHPDPDQRPASMAAVASWSAVPVAPPTVPAGPTRSRETKTRQKAPVERWIIGGAVAAALLLVAGLATFRLLDAPAPPTVETPTLVPASPTAAPNSSTETPPPEQSRPLPPAPQVPPTQSPSADAPVPSPLQAAPTEVPPPVLQTQSPPSPANDTASRVAAYLRRYDGGPCFYAQAAHVTDHSAGVEAFAGSGDAFDHLNDAFKAAIGFEPDIVGHRVWSHQCPAIDFLHQNISDTPGPVLFLKTTRLHNGQSLSGEISQTGGQPVTLLQVHEDGTVEDVTRALVANGDVQDFDLALPSRPEPGPFPQLLIALTGADRAGVSANNGRSAERFFAVLSSTATQRSAVHATAKFVLFGG